MARSEGTPKGVLEAGAGAYLGLHVWQSGSYDRNVTRTAALRAVIDYLHVNPVRRRLVVTAQDWEGLSVRWYAG